MLGGSPGGLAPPKPHLAIMMGQSVPTEPSFSNMTQPWAGSLSQGGCQACHGGGRLIRRRQFDKQFERINGDIGRMRM